MSKYCAYLVAFHSELLPDNNEKAESVFEDMKAELKSTLGCLVYFAPVCFGFFAASGHQKLLQTVKHSAFQPASIKFV
jgi:hypothetical protein